MTALSRSVVGLGVAVAGCTTSFKLDPARTPELVEPYSRCHERVVTRGGRRYAIRPENEPVLSVTARRPTCQPARGKLAPAAPSSAPPPPPGDVDEPVTERFVAPLGDVRAQGDVLYFPDTRAVRTNEIVAARLTVSERPLVALPSKPKEKARPLSSRNVFLGGQIGGTGYGQIVFRHRLFGVPLFLDVGGFFFYPVVHGSAGLVLELPISHRWSVYAGGGGGLGYRYDTKAGCTDEQRQNDVTETCDYVPNTHTITYAYGRLGVALRVGVEGRDQIGVDGGFWNGTIESRSGPPDDESSRSRPILWPMAGVFFVRAL